MRLVRDVDLPLSDPLTPQRERKRGTSALHYHAPPHDTKLEEGGLVTPTRRILQARG